MILRWVIYCENIYDATGHWCKWRNHKRYHKSTQQAGFMCLCHTHTTGNSSNYVYGGKWQKLNSCKVAAFKGKTQFCLIKNLIRYSWCFIAQLDVRLKESSLFPPCSCPHGRWPRPAPRPSSSITIRSPPCLSFLCQLLGQAIRSCQGTAASFPNPDKINAVGLNQSFCNVTLGRQKRNPAIKQTSLHAADVLFTATFLLRVYTAPAFAERWRENKARNHSCKGRKMK